MASKITAGQSFPSVLTRGGLIRPSESKPGSSLYSSALRRWFSNITCNRNVVSKNSEMNYAMVAGVQEIKIRSRDLPANVLFLDTSEGWEMQ